LLRTLFTNTWWCLQWRNSNDTVSRCSAATYFRSGGLCTVLLLIQQSLKILKIG